MRFFLALLFLPLSGFAQQRVTDRLEQYMQSQADVNRFSGAVIVMRNDSVLLKKAYGLANREWNVPAAVDTKFVLASVTKYFTAIAVMQLADAQKLAPEDKLSRFFPDYPRAGEVTIHMLLTHTAGLPLDFDELYMNHTDISKDSAIAVMSRKPYLFTPGTGCKYSNIGYFLLAQIIEKASGETYADYLRKHVFVPAGMYDTGVCNNDSVVARKADIYYRTEDGFAKNPYINWDLNTGHDGVYSTVEDLYRLDRALTGELLLSEEAKKRMATPYNKQYPDDGFFENYGYGIFISPYYNHGHYLLTHSGGFIGTMTSFDRYPEDNAFVAVLSNNEAESHMISYGLAGIVFGKDVEAPYVHTQVGADPAVLLRYIGTYGKTVIRFKDGQLFTGTGETLLLPESETKFFRADNPDRTFEFVLDRKGKVVALVTTKGGVKERAERNRR